MSSYSVELPVYGSFDVEPFEEIREKVLCLLLERKGVWLTSADIAKELGIDLRGTHPTIRKAIRMLRFGGHMIESTRMGYMYVDDPGRRRAFVARLRGRAAEIVAVADALERKSIEQGKIL